MEKITTREQFSSMNYGSRALDTLNMQASTDDNFWMAREQARILSGEYRLVAVEGDDKLRFLHASIDDPDMVAYTKDADKGRADIQTRTTLAAYCEKFGLHAQEVQPPVQNCITTQEQIQERLREMDNTVGRLKDLMTHLRTLLG